MRVFHVFCVAALTCAGLVEPASAAGRSVYTSIANKDCRFDPLGKGPDAAENQVKRCRGLEGAQAVVSSYHTVVGLALRWPGSRDATDLVTGWSLGEKLEWRGPAAGPFRPEAVIVRVIFNDPETDKKHQVLAIMRVKGGKACVMSAVDMTADPKPYETAQRVADEKAPSFVCGRSDRFAAGTPTQWTTHVLE